MNKILKKSLMEKTNKGIKGPFIKNPG